VVLHVSVQPAGFPDFSDITSIRQSGFTFLQSETLQEAQDIALTAHALAIKSGKGVIHFFDSSASAFKKSIEQEDAQLLGRVIDLDAAAAFQHTKSRRPPAIPRLLP
jgi:sulfite reductase (NADPH) hemoprotein beta-component